MKSGFWYAGFAVGLLLALAVGLVTRRLTAHPRTYDERQQLIQGQAYRAAFWTVVSVLALAVLAQELFETAWCSLTTLAVVAVVLGVSVYCLVCIQKDAYLPLRWTPRRFYLSGALVIAMNLLSMVTNLSHRPLVEQGQLGVSAINLLIVVMYLVILLAYAVRQRRSRGQAE